MSEVVATAQQGLAGKYHPYPEYKDSGVELLGDIPIHWIVRRLKHTASIQSGIPKGKDLKDKTAISVPMLRVANVQDGYLNLDDIHQIDIEPHELERYSLRKGDVLMNEGGDNDKLGRGAVWQGDIEPCIHQNHVFAIRTENIEPEWLQQVMQSSYAKFYFYSVAKQSTNLASISSSNIKETPLLIPPKLERIKVLSFLNYETARIDRLITQQHRLIELLKEKRQAVISHAVTKGLNPNATMKDSGVEWLGQVPGHWIVAGFKKYIEPIVDYRGKTPTKTESGVFLVTARNIKNGSIDYSLSEEFISEDDYEEVMRRGKPKLGDVLFTTEAPLGEVAQVDNESIALAQRIIKFRGLRNILDCSYLKLFIQSTEFQHGLMTFATGSTALGIKSDRLGYLKQLVPPISEQTQIVEVVAKHAMQFDKLIDIANKAIQLMLERRTALISAAVTGKIDLRGWTPPAEEAAA